MTRRQFLTRYMPAMIAMPMAELPNEDELPQPPYNQELPPPGADTQVNLTIRMTVQEFKLTGVIAAMKEQGDLIRWALRQLRIPGDPWGDRDRAT
jgi:hypothetical protein